MNRCDKIAMKVVMGLAAPTKWGFDLTEFRNPAAFMRVLSAVGISSSQEPGRGHMGEFIWVGSRIIIVTGNNPITGEYMQPNRRESEPGYASSIGIEGDPDKVAVAVAMIKKNAVYIKGQSKGKREFI